MLTVHTKSILAKLLARENILVQHSQDATTAHFDLKNRILILPAWTQISAALYDLLIGHEVGHALDTPPDGWHDSLVERHKTKTNFKNFLNVIEDARIEKKMKRRYEGLRRAFRLGYEELNQYRDFFNIRKDQMNIYTLPLIDRINLHFKCGMKFHWKPIEERFIIKITNAETFEEVEAIAEELYDYSITEELPPPSQGKESSEKIKWKENEFNQSSEKSLEQVEPDNHIEESNQEEDGPRGDEGGVRQKTWEMKDMTKKIPTRIPQCKTDEAFRINTKTLTLGPTRQILYIDLPTPNLKQIITPAKIVNQLLSNFFKGQKSALYLALKTFRERNDRYISLLVKEFEMRKAAAKYKRTQLHTTGDLDITKIYRYQLDDNIFRKIMQVPEGKSHGLVFFLDKSGSMNNNINGAIEQTFVLTSFCRRVNIPFVVYGFTDKPDIWSVDFPYMKNKERENFLKLPHTLALNDNFALREIINSDMGAIEYHTAMMNQLLLAQQYAHGDTMVPIQEQLSGTPLNETLIAALEIVPQFKDKHKLDLVHTIILHDGDADPSNQYYTHGKYRKDFHICSTEQCIVIRHKPSHQTQEINPYNPLNLALMEMIRGVGIPIIGFYITEEELPTVLKKAYYSKKGEAYKDSQWEDLSNQWKKEHYIESFTPGYNRFFFIPGGTSTKWKTISDIPVGLNRSKLLLEFKTRIKKKETNRILVHKFIDLVAKKN